MKGWLDKYENGNSIKQRKDFKGNFLYKIGMEGKENNYAKGYPDLVRYYGGKPLQGDYLKYSKYKPTKAKNANAEYIAIDDSKFKNEIINRYNTNINDTLPGGTLRVGDKYLYNNPLNALGHFNISKGKDDSGEYLSYYDVYNYARNDNPDVNKTEWMGAAKPYEIYDRVYVDKDSTGTYIPKKENGGTVPLQNITNQDNIRINTPIKIFNNPKATEEEESYVNYINSDYYKTNIRLEALGKRLKDFPTLKAVPNFIKMDSTKLYLSRYGDRYLPIVDTSEIVRYGEDKKELKYLRNATVTKNALKEIEKYSTKYKIDPTMLLSTLALEHPIVKANSPTGFFNLGTNLMGDYKIPDRYNHYNIIDFAKTARAYMKDGSIKYDKLNKKIDEWENSTNKVDSILKTIESPIDAHAMFLSRYGIEKVNPYQQNEPNVKQAYVPRVTEGANYIKTRKLFKKNGGIIPLQELDQMSNFTNYNKPTIGGWLDKY